MPHKASRQMRAKSAHILDLDQNLIVKICKLLSVHDKLQLRMASSTFQDVLDNPAPGSDMWGVVDLYGYDLTSDDILQPMLSWLLRSAPGIKSLRHVPIDHHDPSEDTVIKYIHDKDANKRELLISVLPQLTGLLPQGAETVLDLRWATAESQFAMWYGPHNPEYMFQYWGALSSFLTKLKLAFDGEITAEVSSSLNQLTQLRGLMLEGFSEDLAHATIHLQLPQLTKLTLDNFGNASVSLDCPQLKNLKLLNLDPLLEMSELPDGIERLLLADLSAASVDFEQMLPAHGLKHLSNLGLQQCPGQPSAAREAYVASCLTALSAAPAWVPLLPSQPPWQGLPFNLQDVSLSFALDDGIPLVLEQLTNLVSLKLTHVGDGQMHLTRPLDPFLDMANLSDLQFRGSRNHKRELGRWTPAALRLLGLAARHLMYMPGAHGDGSALRSARLSY